MSSYNNQSKYCKKYIKEILIIILTVTYCFNSIHTSNMTGRGKGGKGLGKGGAKRHRKVLRDNIQVSSTVG